ncbi:MAG: glycosyltransferase [Acidobacteriota bacterium]
MTDIAAKVELSPTKNYPDVSVVIPCRNYGVYLNDAIRSVLGQEGFSRASEIIVVDDGSSEDSTLQILDYWRHRRERVRIVENHGLNGIGAARNRGVSVAGCSWLAFLDADDVWLPGALEERWMALDRFPQAEWIAADFHLWHEDGSLSKGGYFANGDLSREILREAYRSGQPQLMPKPVAHFVMTSLAWTGTVMVKKYLLESLGGFDCTLQRAQDLHMWVRLAAVSDLLFVPKPTALYRQHQASVSHRHEEPESWSILAYSKLLSDPKLTGFRPAIRKKMAYFHAQNAYFHRQCSQKSKAVMAAAAAVRYDPLRLQLWKNLLATCMLRP